MRWNSEQIEAFETQGFLLVPNLFSAAEVALLNSEIPRFQAMHRPEILRETGSTAVRSVISPHRMSDPFRAMSLHPRLIEPARQVLRGEVYLHQFKVNTKAAHDGEIWHWHQDYRTWYEDDGMPEPHVINATVFLDDVTEFNGPMMFIPGSHKRGRLDATRNFERIPGYGRLAADAIGSPYSDATIDELINGHGLVAPKGTAGSGLFFHGCTVHGSAPNMSPWRRNMLFASLNRVDNTIRRPTRPEYLALQDFSVLKALDDDCLQRLEFGAATQKFSVGADGA